MNRFKMLRRSWRRRSWRPRVRQHFKIIPLEDVGELNDDQTISRLFYSVCRFLGVRGEWQWNDRYLSTAGTELNGLVELSSFVWKFATPEQRYWVIIHEVCHIDCPGMHGPEWKARMRRCGAEPMRCHPIRPRGICLCSNWRVSFRTASRILKGTPHFCTCGQPIMLTNVQT